MKLTDTKVKNARPTGSAYKLADGQGMYLLVKADGGRYWRLKYRYAGKEKLLALGVYPDVSLRDARTKRDEARGVLGHGKDPGAERRAAKLLRKHRAATSFEAVALEWFEARKARWSKVHADAVHGRLKNQLFPDLGTVPVAEVDTQRLLATLRKIESRGALEVASKARVVAGQVLRYAIATGRATVDASRDLRGALKTREKRHYARLSEEDLPVFLQRLEQYDGTVITRLAIRLLVLTFVRTAELRGAHWSEFNTDKREWRIPAERMKSGREHIVPLSSQALQALEELRAITGEGDLLFPNEHHADKPMSENTILYALYRMGYRGRATGHGFRATASTILNEQGWDADVVERQLAHKEKNEVRAAYHHSQYLLERRKMMQAWADFLDAKREAGDKVVSFHRGARTRAGH